MKFKQARVNGGSNYDSLKVAKCLVISALNVKVMKFKQARVNGGSNYDSLKVAKCLVI